MHPRCGYDSQGEAKNTEVLLKALDNPLINIIAHPGNPKYPVNTEALVAAAKAHGVLIEINNSSGFSRPGSHQRCLEIAREVKKQDWLVALGTDSHISPMLGNFSEALALIAEAGLTEEQVVNTSWEKVEKYLLARK
jgi:putative hydrolase